MRTVRWTAVWLLGALAAGSCHAQAANEANGAVRRNVPAKAFDAVVKRVPDGDTVWIQTANQARAKWVKVRIQGIDAPEICQSGGPASRNALAARVLDKRVSVLAEGRDSYGRLLARLATVGPGAGRSDVGAAMVKNGQAWSYRFRWNPGPYASEQRLAKTAGRGLFSAPDAEEPWLFRKRHGPCDWPKR